MRDRTRQFRVYLAGKMSGRDADEVRTEREQAKLLLRALSHNISSGPEIVPVDPAEGEDLREGVVGTEALDYEMPSDRFMVERDFALVGSCNAVLVLTADTPAMSGTMFEWAYARLVAGIPVFSVCADSGGLGSWRREMSTACGLLGDMIRAIGDFALSL